MYSQTCEQRPRLGPGKRDGYAEGCLKKLASDWPLLTGGRYSEAAFRSGLTVLRFC